MQKICGYCRKCAENVQEIYRYRYCRKYAAIAENLQVLQKMSRKSAGIAENMPKICKYYRKCAENM